MKFSTRHARISRSLRLGGGKGALCDMLIAECKRAKEENQEGEKGDCERMFIISHE